MDIPATSSALFHLAPDPDYSTRLTKEMQSTRELLEARVSEWTQHSVPDPREVVALKKTLNAVCSRILQKTSMAKRLRGKLEEELRERCAAEGEMESAGNLISKIRKLVSEIEQVNRRTLEEESQAVSHHSLKSKESASLVRTIQLISKERVQELEGVYQCLLRKYEVVQQTHFKATSHLNQMHEELRRETKSAHSLRKRQEYYSELAESVRQQRQETVERGIAAVSKAKLSWEDRQISARRELSKLQTEVKELEAMRREVRERKEAVERLQSQISVLAKLVPEAQGDSQDFPLRVIAKFRDLSHQQVMLSGRFQELSADHDVKKKQCDDIRAEMERIKAGMTQGTVHWTGSVNMIRAAVEDNQKCKKLKKESHDSEQLVLGLYLRLTHFLTSVLQQLQTVTADNSLVAALKAALKQMTEGPCIEPKKEVREQLLGKRKNSVQTFSTEVDVPSLKPALSYALSVEDIQQSLMRFHPQLALSVHDVAVQLRAIPAIAHFISIPRLEAYLQGVDASDVLLSSGRLVSAGYEVLQQKLSCIRDSLPLFRVLNEAVDSTDMSSVPSSSKSRPPHPTPRVRALPVDGSEDAPRISENLSKFNETDEDENVTCTQAYLESARREAKEMILKAKTVDIPRSFILPRVDSLPGRFPRKQGVVLKLAQLEDKLKLLRVSEKSAIEHLKQQRELSSTHGKREDSRSQHGSSSFRSLSSANSFEMRPGTSAFRIRSSSRRPSGTSARPQTVYQNLL